MEPDTKSHDPTASSENANTPNAGAVESRESCEPCDSVISENSAPQETVKDKLEQSLTCPVCMTICAPPTQSCVNGHLICATCKLKIPQCPICSAVYGAQNKLTRQLGLESLAEFSGITCNCPNAALGCTLTFKYDAKVVREHLKTCVYREVFCPCCDRITMVKDLDDHYKKMFETEKVGVQNLYHYHSPNNTFTFSDNDGANARLGKDSIFLKPGTIINSVGTKNHTYFYAYHLSTPEQSGKWWSYSVTLTSDNFPPQTLKTFTVHLKTAQSIYKPLCLKLDEKMLREASNKKFRFETSAEDVDPEYLPSLQKYV